jgi:L-glyceraldehyde 3-phosphate reductase
MTTVEPYQAAPDRYEAMPYRRVGRSGLKLPALSLGLWHNFGDEHLFGTQRDTLRRAFDLGITHFDLANNYGPKPGAAEENFGRHFAADFRPYRDQLIISTKAGYDMGPGPIGPYQEWGSRKYLLSSLDASLRRMGLDYVDIFYSHRPDPETPLEETMGALAQAVRSGKALYVGISNYSPSQTRAAHAILADMGVRLLIHQPSYSMYNRHVELVGPGETENLLDVVGELGVGTIVFSPLAQGLLTNRYLSGSVPAMSRVAQARFVTEENLTPEYFERTRALDEFARGRGQSLAELALTWLLRDERVTSALIGASSVAQLEDNVAALAAPPLTTEEISTLEQWAVDGTGMGQDE